MRKLWIILAALALAALLAFPLAAAIGPPQKPDSPSTLSEVIKMEGKVSGMLLVVEVPAVRGQQLPVHYIIFVMTDGGVYVASMDEVKETPLLAGLYGRLWSLGRYQILPIHPSTRLPGTCT